MKRFKVSIVIERLEPGGSVGGREEERLELASFSTFEEAMIFVREMQQKYSARATGEAAILDEMDTPEEFTAGD